MSINIDVKNWIQTNTVSAVTNSTSETPDPGGALDICNEADIDTAIHFVGFAITTVNGIGYFMAGTRLALPYIALKMCDFFILVIMKFVSQIFLL